MIKVSSPAKSPSRAYASRGVVSHQATGASSLRSASMANGTLSVPAGNSPFSASSSGITIFNFSMQVLERIGTGRKAAHVVA
jgi:hypothetical protein